MEAVGFKSCPTDVELIKLFHVASWSRAIKKIGAYAEAGWKY